MTSEESGDAVTEKKYPHTHTEKKVLNESNWPFFIVRHQRREVLLLQQITNHRQHDGRQKEETANYSEGSPVKTFFLLDRPCRSILMFAGHKVIVSHPHPLTEFYRISPLTSWLNLPKI